MGMAASSCSSRPLSQDSIPRCAEAPASSPDCSGRHRRLEFGALFGQRPNMSECGERAVLIITKALAGTATHVARSRTILVCRLAPEHPGKHCDSQHQETWESRTGMVPTIIRQEGESGSAPDSAE